MVVVVCDGGEIGFTHADTGGDDERLAASSDDDDDVATDGAADAITCCCCCCCCFCCCCSFCFCSSSCILYLVNESTGLFVDELDAPPPPVKFSPAALDDDAELVAVLAFSWDHEAAFCDDFKF